MNRAIGMIDRLHVVLDSSIYKNKTNTIQDLYLSILDAPSRMNKEGKTEQMQHIETIFH